MNIYLTGIPPLDGLLKFLIIWASIDIVVISTYWYAKTVIQVQFPNWWRQNICDEGPEIEPMFDEGIPVTSDSLTSGNIN